MKGQYSTFRYEFQDDSLIISSADPGIGELKRYPLHGSLPETEGEAALIAKGRIDLDMEELSDIEISLDKGGH